MGANMSMSMSATNNHEREGQELEASASAEDIAGSLGKAVARVSNALVGALGLEESGLNVVCNEVYAQAVAHVSSPFSLSFTEHSRRYQFQSNPLNRD